MPLTFDNLAILSITLPNRKCILKKLKCVIDQTEVIFQQRFPDHSRMVGQGQPSLTVLSTQSC